VGEVSEENNFKTENKVIKKEIDSSMENIDPNNYVSVTEFLDYFKS
jgi:hypothetical protein